MNIPEPKAIFDDFGKIRLPFKRFRVFANNMPQTVRHLNGTIEEKIKPVKMVVYEDDISGKIVVVGQTDVSAFPNHIPLIRLDISNKDINNGMPTKTSIIDPLSGKYGGWTPNKEGGCSVNIFGNDWCVPHKTPEEATHALGDPFCQLLQQVSSDFLNPHLFACKKSPPIPKGKSIIWQQQREHYVLLHKSHPANTNASKDRKKIDDEPQILKAAHCRRAHFRLLKSAKFKYKIGQRIFIRATWVGPKEWQDRAGQIYKIIEQPKTITF
jgi:hypothetical protein